MNDNFSEAPATRRAPRPEDVGLTPAEIRERDIERLLGPSKVRERPPQWQPGAPSPPAILALLAIPHDPDTGRPVAPRRSRLPKLHAAATDAELTAHSGRVFRAEAEFEEADDEFMRAFAFYASLDAMQKTQLSADSRWGKEDNPAWVVSVATDPNVPPAVIRAKDAAEAVARYKQLCGIIGVDQPPGFYGDLIPVSPYVPQESP
jgi:hypothetical protein